MYIGKGHGVWAGEEGHRDQDIRSVVDEAGEME